MLNPPKNAKASAAAVVAAKERICLVIFVLAMYIKRCTYKQFPYPERLFLAVQPVMTRPG